MQGALAAARAKVAAAGAALQGAREVVRGVENRVKEVSGTARGWLCA